MGIKMPSDNIDNEERFEGNDEAILFEAISHPTRISMLFTLEKGPLGFSKIKRNLGLSSSGNLQHHIGKLTTLVELDSNGDYILSDQGREAIMAIRAVRNINNPLQDDPKLVTLVTTLAFYVAQINTPFITGSFNQLTPLYTLVGSLVFAPIFYLIYTKMLARKLKSNSEL